MGFYRYMSAFFALLGCAWLSGCLAADQVATSPAYPATNELLIKEETFLFRRTGDTGVLALEDGTELKEFLMRLGGSTAGQVRLTPLAADISSEDLEAMTVETGLFRSVIVTIGPAEFPDGTENSLRVEVIYALNKLANCQDYLSIRKLDDVRLTSPGFGCAVERNLRLSLASPAPRGLSPRLHRPSAEQDAKAVRQLMDRPPVAFPPVDK